MPNDSIQYFQPSMLTHTAHSYKHTFYETLLTTLWYEIQFHVKLYWQKLEFIMVIIHGEWFSMMWSWIWNNLSRVLCIPRKLFSSDKRHTQIQSLQGRLLCGKTTNVSYVAMSLPLPFLFSQQHLEISSLVTQKILYQLDITQMSQRSDARYLLFSWKRYQANIGEILHNTMTATIFWNCVVQVVGHLILTLTKRSWNSLIFSILVDPT